MLLTTTPPTSCRGKGLPYHVQCGFLSFFFFVLSGLLVFCDLEVLIILLILTIFLGLIALLSCLSGAHKFSDIILGT